MADFCQQCSIATFGADHGDYAGLTTPEETQEGWVSHVFCEGCGPTQVDHTGKCVNPHCLEEGHRAALAPAAEADRDRLAAANAALEAQVARLVGALQSIATNTCCDGCQEAARVARAALAAFRGDATGGGQA